VLLAKNIFGSSLSFLVGLTGTESYIGKAMVAMGVLPFSLQNIINMALQKLPEERAKLPTE
jgi:hypothetical protein